MSEPRNLMSPPLVFAQMRYLTPKLVVRKDQHIELTYDQFTGLRDVRVVDDDLACDDGLEDCG